MKLTNEIIENNGFKRINNSMFRLNNITLQNTTKYSGVDMIEKLFSMEKAYKVCIDGKYFNIITDEFELNVLKIMTNNM